MRLRARRRNLVIWSSSAGLAGRHGITFTRPARRKRILRGFRIIVQLAVMGLLGIARGDTRLRWQLLLAGGMLTVTGIALRSDPAGMVLLPGLLMLFSAPLIPDIPAVERKRHLQLEDELAAYSTPAQRRDLEATFAQYPDADTAELRDILAAQAQTAGSSGIPGSTQF
jgi:hypothetical protein